MSLLLFAGAVYVLHSELRDHPLHEILAELRSFPPLRLSLSLAATVLGFLALAGYDAVSLAALGRRLPFRRVAYRRLPRLCVRQLAAALGGDRRRGALSALLAVGHRRAATRRGSSRSTR